MFKPGRDRSPHRLPPDDVTRGRYRHGDSFGQDSGYHDNPDFGTIETGATAKVDPSPEKKMKLDHTMDIRSRIIHGDSADAGSSNLGNNATVDGPGGGSDLQLPATRTVQSYDVKPYTTIGSYTCESTYHVRSKIDAAFSAANIDVVPWESMRHCHNDLQWLPNLEKGIAWRPIGASVEIFNMRAHADITINTASFFPVNLDQARVRYIRHDVPLSARVGPFETVAQYNSWRTLLDNQADGIYDKDLPTTHVYVGQGVNNGREIDYDECFWVSKKVVDDEMLNFSWKGTGPWRNPNELYMPTEIKLPTGSNDAVQAHKYATYLVEPRFDYREGIIESPFGDYRTLRQVDGSTTNNANHNKPMRVCFKHSYVTKDLLNTFNSLSKSITDTSATALDLNTHAERKKYLGDNSTIFSGVYQMDFESDLEDQEPFSKQYHTLPDEPYYDNNVMKPIYLSFSRFMKNDNLQEYRVYYELRIKHHYQVLHSAIPNFLNLRSSNNVWPNSNGIGIAAKLLPLSIWSAGDDSAAENDKTFTNSFI